MEKRGKGIFKKINLKLLLLSFFIVYLFAFLGSIFSSSEVNSAWYQSIRPYITPPNWVFPIVWNILFFLIASALYLSLTKAKTKLLNENVRLMFGINLVLNLLWSFLFFYLKNPILAFIDLVALWFSILILICLLWKIDKLSSWLLVPYSLWIGFAGILNYIMAFL